MHGRGGATAQRHQNRLMVDSHTQLSLPDVGLAAIARAHAAAEERRRGVPGRTCSGPQGRGRAWGYRLGLGLGSGQVRRAGVHPHVASA